ncbi:hypothetical protein EOA13_11120 [Mesorhizobium sp. M7A.F.Ca.US.011.01.1.1]|uniref:hypothetical protein n=1 Tax=Mesorhizobium sp. M7A.F.Ca.US.011.01.1.1 TaxID=2496741 RepID=UPI000FCC7689|nr:hypothetical protein [Mesorhizobium sp. M7A.F.Ca.US.011.01.1.1]RUX29931.1 hypothetical protein EOA13_11120 [Mesorhizobium sp. M7A.F.Ca.US.011.01.1.1]
MRRGWEFWLGASFVVAAMALVAPAYFLPDWRAIVSSIGAATAAFAVVGASLIAYDGALAKVRFDRSIQMIDRDLRRRQILTKLDFTARLIILDTRQVRDAIGVFGEAPPDDFDLNEPTDMADLWNRIGELPKDKAAAVAFARLNYSQYKRLLAGYRQMCADPMRNGSQVAAQRRRELAGITIKIADAAKEMAAGNAVTLAAEGLSEAD